MGRAPLICALLLFAFACASARTDRVVIAADRMLDVETGRYVENAIVTVEGDRIIGVRSGPAPDGAIRVPTLLPGLIDAHVHLVWSGAPGDDAAKATVNAGFTTVRNLGSNANVPVRFDAPRVVFSGPGLGPENGICHQTFGTFVRDAADAREQVRAQVRDLGATWIKVCAGGGVVGIPKDAESGELSPELLAAIVDEARKLNVKVAAHAQGPIAIRNAVLAGVDSIEHGGLIDRETALLMREKNVALVPTLARLEGRPTVKTRTFAAVSEAVKAGVTIVLGTDATVLPHGKNAEELVALVEVGLTPLEAIRAATTRAAALLGLRDVGRIAKGASADLVAVNGDPLNDVGALREPVFVMARGKVVVP
jgi:imidazolonepropionase-like amidohydrolase